MVFKKNEQRMPEGAALRPLRNFLHLVLNGTEACGRVWLPAGTAFSLSESCGLQFLQRIARGIGSDCGLDGGDFFGDFGRFLRQTCGRAGMRKSPAGLLLHHR